MILFLEFKTGKKWEIVLQVVDRKYWRASPYSLYSNCWWSLSEIWKYFQATSGFIHQFKRQVCNFYLITLPFFPTLTLLITLIFIQGKDSRCVKELAWKECTSYCCYWRRKDLGIRRSWVSGIHRILLHFGFDVILIRLLSFVCI